jgi:transposase
VFYYADEFNISWFPTLHAIWGPKGQQVMIPTPGQPKRQYGIGGVNYHTGETVVLIRKRKRRREIAEFLQALVDKHPTGTIYVAWDNANTHQDDEVEAVVRAAAGRLVLLYLPTYSPWLNPIEMLWRHFRREVTHCELYETVNVSFVQPEAERNGCATRAQSATNDQNVYFPRKARVVVLPSAFRLEGTDQRRCCGP